MAKYVVTVVPEFVRGNQTLNNDGCTSYEDASAKAEKCGNDWGDDPNIEIFVGIVAASSEEEAIQIAEDEAPYYRYMLQASPVSDNMLN